MNIEHMQWTHARYLYRFTFPSTVREGSLFSTSSPAFIISRFFDDGHSDQSEVIFHCSVDLHLSNNSQCWESFHVLVDQLYVFWRNVYLGLLPIFWLFFFVFLCWTAWAVCNLNILEINFLSVIWFPYIFSLL